MLFWPGKNSVCKGDGPEDGENGVQCHLPGTGKDKVTLVIAFSYSCKVIH